MREKKLTKKQSNLHPADLTLLNIVIRQEYEDQIYVFLKKYAVANLFEMYAKGSANNSILSKLGLVESEYSYFVSIIKKVDKLEILNFLDAFYIEHKNSGVSFTNSLDAYVGVNTLSKVFKGDKNEL